MSSSWLSLSSIARFNNNLMRDRFVWRLVALRSHRHSAFEHRWSKTAPIEHKAISSNFIRFQSSCCCSRKITIQKHETYSFRIFDGVGGSCICWTTCGWHLLCRWVLLRLLSSKIYGWLLPSVDFSALWPKSKFAYFPTNCLLHKMWLQESTWICFWYHFPFNTGCAAVVVACFSAAGVTFGTVPGEKIAFIVIEFVESNLSCVFFCCVWSICRLANCCRSGPGRL